MNGSVLFFLYYVRQKVWPDWARLRQVMGSVWRVKRGDERTTSGGAHTLASRLNYLLSFGIPSSGRPAPSPLPPPVRNETAVVRHHHHHAWCIPHPHAATARHRFFSFFFFTFSACLLSLPICALFIRLRSLRGSAPVRTACLVSSSRAVGLFTDWTSLRVCLFLYLPQYTRAHRYKHTYSRIRICYSSL